MKHIILENTRKHIQCLGAIERVALQDVITGGKQIIEIPLQILDWVCNTSFT